jgi:hypothetical protein
MRIAKKLGGYGLTPRFGLDSLFGTSKSRFGVLTRTRFEIAGIAQLVEHHLAKVGVAGSSPVSRSPGSGEAWRFVGSPLSFPGSGAVAKW